MVEQARLQRPRAAHPPLHTSPTLLPLSLQSTNLHLAPPPPQVKDHFIFTIESTGAWRPHELFQYAVEVRRALPPSPQGWQGQGSARVCKYSLHRCSQRSRSQEACTCTSRSAPVPARLCTLSLASEPFTPPLFLSSFFTYVPYAPPCRS